MDCDRTRGGYRLFALRSSDFFFQAEDGIRDIGVTGVQTCALPILVAEVPLDLAGDGRDGEGEELHPTARVEPVDGRDQAEGADLQQVVEGLAAVAEPAGEVPHQRQVFLDEDLAQPLTARVVLVQGGQLGERRRCALPPPTVLRDGGGAGGAGVARRGLVVLVGLLVGGGGVLGGVVLELRVGVRRVLVRHVAPDRGAGVRAGHDLAARVGHHDGLLLGRDLSLRAAAAGRELVVAQGVLLDGLGFWGRRPGHRATETFWPASPSRWSGCCPGRYLSMEITATGEVVPSPAGTVAWVAGPASTSSTRVCSTAQPKPSRGTSVPSLVGTQASMCRPRRVGSKTTGRRRSSETIAESVAQASSTASRRSSTASRS